MRLQGRQLALLIAGAFPLLAENDVPTGGDELHVPIKAIFETQDEHDFVEHTHGAAEALHDDVLRSLPSLSIELLNDIPLHEEDTRDQFTGRRNDNVQLLDENIDGSAGSNGHRDRKDGSAMNQDNNEERPPGEDQTVGEELNTDPVISSKEQILETADANSISYEAVTDSTETDPSDVSQTNETEETDQQTQIEKEEEDVTTKKVVVDYASKSAGALILESSPSMKGTSNLLNSDRDKYAIVPCEDKKVVAISLSEDILVERVKLANYERYSSHVQKFQILGSQDMVSWDDLGSYTASPDNEEQTFVLIEPSWARYLKFRFISHSGDEFYCTVSQIKVHGKTNLQDFKERTERDKEQTKQLLNDLDDAGTSSHEDNVEAEAMPSAAANTSIDDRADGDNSLNISKEPASENATSAKRALAREEEGSKVSNSEQQMVRGEGTPCSEVSDKPASGEDISDGSEKDTTNTHVNIASETLTVHLKNDQSYSSSEQVKQQSLQTFDTLNKDYRESSVNSYNLSLPEALMSFPWEENIGISNALASASIEVSSSKSALALRTPAAEKLEMSAMHPMPTGVNTIKEAVNVVVARASDYSMSFKERMKTTIETTMGVIVHEEALNILGGNNYISGEGLQSPKILEEDNSAIFLSESEITSNAANEIPSVASSATIEGEEVITTGVEAHTINRSDQFVHDDMNTDIAHVLKRFPNAECLESLHYQEFKSKIFAKAAVSGGSSGPIGGAAPGSGRNEPIFKTLTDEIKALQINQSVNDQFNKALVSCYQKVLLDMAVKIESLEKRQEARLSQLEATIQDMKSETLTTELQNVSASAISFLCLQAIALYTKCLSLAEDERVHSFVISIWAMVKYFLSRVGEWVMRAETEQLQFTAVFLVFMLLARQLLRLKWSSTSIIIERQNIATVSKIDPPEEITDIRQAEVEHREAINESKEEEHSNGKVDASVNGETIEILPAPKFVPVPALVYEE